LCEENGLDSWRGKAEIVKEGEGVQLKGYVLVSLWVFFP
jgi:hypothetical protein